MEQPKRLPQQSCTNIISFMLCIAILCMTCYNTISQGRLSGAINKLESKVETIESDIRAWNTRKSKQYYGETNPFHQQDAKTEAKKLEKFYYAGLLEKLKTRLHVYEAVSRNNRIATRELRKAFDTFKRDMHLSGRLYHVFGNQNVLVKRRDKRAVGQNGKAKNIPLKLYVPVSLTVTENKTLGAIITLRGPPGQKGQSGEKGQPGEKGSSGSRGGRGKAGPQGVKGDKGDFGPKGDIGPVGRTGAKGQKGDKGDRGLKGKEGGKVAVPKIVVAPADQIVLSPDRATFTCEATGSPKPEVTLMPQGKKKDGRFETFGEGTLSIKNVTFADRGVIECVAKSVLGEDRSTAHLIVNVKAKATIKAKDIRTESELNVVINCDVRGFPEPIVSWKRSGKNLAIKTKFSNNNKRMQLVGVTTDDGGDYVCQAVNAHATSLTTVSVTVVKRLAFIAVPSKKMVVNAFSNFKIPCAYIGGLPPVRATWQKDGKKLQDKAIISQDFRTLEIKNAKKEDMGKYTCHVRSKMSSISLSVDVSPSNSYLPTCDSLKQYGVTNSGNYLINPSSSPFERPLSVYCDMGGQSAVTVVSHDSEARRRVQGFETAGSYSRKVKYSVSASDLQIKALTRISKNCEQYIKYECTASGMWLHQDDANAWWISFTGRKMLNWGGVAYPKKGCACTLTKTCDGSDTCMCDINKGSAIDEGYLRDKDFLPVKELRFGDTGDNGEFGYHTLGKLRCS